MSLQLRQPLAFFDLESTGISPVNDRIVEIAIVKLLPNGQREQLTQRINPERPIPAETSAIHRIFDADVADKPTFKAVGHKLARFLDGADLCGFNVLKFDLPMLVEEFLRADIPFDTDNRRIVDAQRIFHMMEPRTLTAAYKFYCGKDLTDAHSAEADTLATVDVLLAQVDRYEGVTINDRSGKPIQPVKNDVQALHDLTASNQIDYAGRLVKDKDGEAAFNFGKYRGQKVLQVLQRDPSYYDWMLKGNFALDTKRKLTAIKLSQFSQGRLRK